MLSFLVAMTLAAQGATDVPGPGIAETLARERAATIGNLRYELAFVIPATRKEAVQGRAVLRFTLQTPHRVVLDFAQPADRLRTVRAGGVEVRALVENGHLTIPADATRAGENEIAIDFVAGDESLNRTDEFLYTLFVPARAHLAFPSFDQPNLKARYTLALTVPAGWEAVANGAERDRDGRHASISSKRNRCRPISSGSWPGNSRSRRLCGTAATSACSTARPTRQRLARNRDAMFDLHASALAWLEDYTAVPYPWGKFDFVMIPAFQFTGMEHAGAILYNASLLLDESATQQQQLGRATTIAHETAHMWFGNLVTMEWFSDVWMKEVFANFMAAKIVNPAFPQVNHDLRFLLAHYPGAYEVDRTAGTNPIRQPLANLNEAGQLYGAIIYQKAPIMMRQLELMIGETALRDGLRQYLKQHAYANATWLDLVAILDAKTPENLAAWSRAWVEERGRPAFATTLRTGRRGITALTLEGTDPLQRGLVWPQRLERGARLPRVGRRGAGHRDRVFDERSWRHRQAASAVRVAEWGRARLRPVRAGSREPAVSARASRGDSGRADARQRMGHALGEHARGARRTGCVRGPGITRAAAGDGRTEPAACSFLPRARLLAPPAPGISANGVRPRSRRCCATVSGGPRRAVRSRRGSTPTAT